MTDYPRFHQDRLNLALHLVAVPFFVLGTLGGFASLWAGRWLWAVALLALPPLSLAVQGFGHKRERNPPVPFRGPIDFVQRILLEQFYRFPLFVMSGGWARARRKASTTS